MRVLQGLLYFYPRPPGGGRHLCKSIITPVVIISIHALRVEGDCKTARILGYFGLFLSTPSGWRATTDLTAERRVNDISIHALRVEGDRRSAGHVVRTPYHFYPRPPGGGRPDTPNSTTQGSRFLSTPSGWRATRRVYCPLVCPQNFYPRPPGGGRHAGIDYGVREYPISIHALRVEGDRGRRQVIT